MANVQTEPVGAGGKIAYFFRQTFRRHSRAEYSELLTRGMRGAKGVNRKYPWAYLRMFALLFVLFAVYLLIVRFTYTTSNELFIPTVEVLGSVCVNIPLLLLIYELYPEKDLSFMSVLLALLLGGAGVNIVSQILYSILPPSDAWIKAVLSGIYEELPKAAATVVVIVSVKKRSPLAGFVLGAAVGCGYSIVEDLGYVFTTSAALPAMNLTEIIKVTVARGFSSLCTHMLWTAAIGWAYNLFNKWVSNIVFYLTIILSVGLHICWDLPLSGLSMGLAYAACAIVTCVESVLILSRERNRVFNAARPERPSVVGQVEDAVQPVNGAEASAGEQPLSASGHIVFEESAEAIAEIAEGEGAEAAAVEVVEAQAAEVKSEEIAVEGAAAEEIAASVEAPAEGVRVSESAAPSEGESVSGRLRRYFEEDSLSMNTSSYKFWRHWGHVACALGAFLMAVIAIIYCALPFRETYGTETFNSAEEFVYFMQCGLDLKAEESRTYDPDPEVVKDDITLNGGNLVQCVVGEGGYKYFYEYSVTYDFVTDRNYYFQISVHVQVNNPDGSVVTYAKEELYHGGGLYASFFRVTASEVSGFNFDKNGKLTVYIYDPAFEMDLSDWRYVSLFVAFGAIAGASIVCYVSFKIKSWRVKKICTTRTVYSAR